MQKADKLQSALLFWNIAGRTSGGECTLTKSAAESECS